MTLEPPVLTASSVVIITREGGLAHFPGLGRPRRIACADCSEVQRQALQRLLVDMAHRCGGDRRSGGADRRVFRICLDEGRQARQWTLEIAEEQAPDALIALWKRGEVGTSS
ncbi:protealysin inhibitor emfourin [Litchfieldella rifensis]|uniref:Protealysin inhibitor emfourin n=1 Tax=Litchfieldella rifensis TaxID=762643 RepID=A0ABV7LKW4_9GAMM